jgi:hypothetical protein
MNFIFPSSERRGKTRLIPVSSISGRILNFFFPAAGTLTSTRAARK